MRRVLLAPTACALWFALSLSAARADDGGESGALTHTQEYWSWTKGLMTGNEDEVLDYLKNHRIPHHFGQPSTETIDHPLHIAEVRRALDLFESGSQELRLAIARSLVWTPAGEIDRFWKACEPSDTEAKHYLVGLVLSFGSAEAKEEARRWLLEGAHPSYAAALLKNLDEYNLFRSVSEGEKEKTLKLLPELYRQPGPVPQIRNASDWFEWQLANKERSVQWHVIAALPSTAAAQALVLEWMVADSKKMDEATVLLMWDKWGVMVRAGIRKEDKAFYDDAARRLAVAESWCLSGYGAAGRAFSPFDEASQALERNAWAQIANPDTKVRRAALRRWLLGHASLGGKALDVIEDQHVPAALRQRALADAKQIYRDLKSPASHILDAEKAGLDERFRQVIEALEE